MQTKIIYEDDDIIIVQKPAGMPTQTKGVGQKDVVSELKVYLHKTTQNTPYVGIVHRLDQPVEGLLVFGKNRKSTAKLSAGLQDGQVNKKYYAILYGKYEKAEGSLEDYMYKSDQQMAVIVPSEQAKQYDAKRAVLQYRLLKATEQCSLVDIRLQTGRFHQIRAQFSHSGFPLLGDLKYGNEISNGYSREKGIRNVALFAYQIDVKHPVTGKNMSFHMEPRLISDLFGNFTTL